MHTPLCAGKTIPIECKGRGAPRRIIKRCILSCSGPACRPHSFCRLRSSRPKNSCWKQTCRRSDWNRQSKRMKNSFLRSASSPSQSPSVPALPRGEPLAKPGTLPYCQRLPLWGSWRAYARLRGRARLPFSPSSPPPWRRTLRRSPQSARGYRRLQGLFRRAGPP